VSLLPEGVRTLPLYAYRCTQCGHRFEKIQNFNSQQESVCPVCQGVLERPLTAPRLHFKGAGWYVNDYAAKSSEPASESGSEKSSESGKGAALAETKTPSASSETASSTPAAASTAASTTSPTSSTPSSTS
jgi:putative FmdB family regulatory protein